MADDPNHSRNLSSTEGEHLLPAPPEVHLLGAPEQDQHVPSPPPDGDLALYMLYEQQEHLRGKVEKLEKDAASADKKQQDGDSSGKDGKGAQGGEKKDQKQDSEQKDGDKGGSKEGGDAKSEKKPEDEGAKRRKRARFIFLGVIATLVLLLFTAWLLWYLAGYENTDDAFIEGHNDPISTRVNGTVVAVFVENTFRVKKGQLLLELDPRDYQVAKLQADANYRQAVSAERAQQPQVPVSQEQQTTNVLSAELEVARLEAQLQQREEQFRSAESDLREAEVNQANAVTEEKRYRELVERDEVSRERYDEKRTAKDAETALVASRRQQANAAQKVVSQTAAQLSQAQVVAKRNRAVRPQQVETEKQTLEQRKAASQSSLAQADQAELNLEYTRIYAPEDGIIGDKQVQILSRVTAGQELLTLTQTNDIWVTANFKETQIRKMRRGQHVQIHVDALGEDFDGYVEDLPGASGAVYSLLPPENATGNYVKVVQRLPVRIRFNPGQRDAVRLAPGMSVEPKVMFR